MSKNPTPKMDGLRAMRTARHASATWDSPHDVTAREKDRSNSGQESAEAESTRMFEMIIFTVEVYEAGRHWTEAPRRKYMLWADYFAFPAAEQSEI